MNIHRDVAETEQAVLPLDITDGQGRSQFRISQVQVLNWGAYSGLQSMVVARSGIAIIGPSGRGKSTLLDAMASVILPNPQEFNQAARDDRGKKRERTVYSYARGHTDQRQDENRRSATTNYLRPPGGVGFPSGAAITWDTEDGRRVTSFRLAWVGSDADGPEAVSGTTVYGFVHDRFDLKALNGISAVRPGTSPLAKSSVERLIDLERGDIVDPSQARVHAKMRTVMGMGSTDESQRLAMQLLRRAQASKGIFSINALFKEFVLTEPLALTRWDIALEAYREASRLYEEFEAARRRTDTLSPLPGVAEHYRAAGADYIAKNRLLLPDDERPARIQVWHAEKIAAWAESEIDQVRLAKADLEEELYQARRKADAAELREQDTIAKLTAAGGDRSEAIKLRLDHATEHLRRLEVERRLLESRLSSCGLALPSSFGDVTLAHASIDIIATQRKTALQAASEWSGKAEARFWRLRDEAEAKGAELRSVQARRSLIPEEADERRNRLVAGLRIDPNRARYAGELLQLRHEERRWEKAVVGLLRPLASTLLIDTDDFARARRYVHDHDMHGSLTIAPVPSSASSAAQLSGGVPALLDIAEHPFQAWLAHELNETANYLCVETEDELERTRPSWARGSITPAGMRTGSRNRLTKDDRRPRYPWIGWDNRRLQQELKDELESLGRERQVASGAASDAAEQRDSERARVEELQNLRSDLTWDRINISEAQETVEELSLQLTQVNSAEVADLAELFKIQRSEAVTEIGRVQRLQEDRDGFNTKWGDLATVVDAAKSLIDSETPLNRDERAALASLPFVAPHEPNAVSSSLRDAIKVLREQVERHKDDRAKLEESVIARLAAYRNLDERTAKETDGTIDSLPAVLAIYEQLVTDDLPRAKNVWLAKVDDDMNRQLRGVLVQIDDDARAITRGLSPINEVLSNVPFRTDATLSIESVERGTSDLKDFRQIVTRYTSNTVGIDTDRDAAQVEESFVRLRKRLARLDDPSRAGDAWRRRVFDAREQVEFQAIESRTDGVKVVHDGVSGMSGGEGQELIAFILGAALRFRLGEGHKGPPRYASMILDEGFVKADSEFTGRSLSALRALGFQVIVGAPREKATAFEGYVDSVGYINVDADDPAQVRIYPMTMAEALHVEEERH